MAETGGFFSKLRQRYAREQENRDATNFVVKTDEGAYEAVGSRTPPKNAQFVTLGQGEDTRYVELFAKKENAEKVAGTNRAEREGRVIQVVDEKGKEMGFMPLFPVDMNHANAGVRAVNGDIPRFAKAKSTQKDIEDFTNSPALSEVLKSRFAEVEKDIRQRVAEGKIASNNPDKPNEMEDIRKVEQQKARLDIYKELNGEQELQKFTVANRGHIAKEGAFQDKLSAYNRDHPQPISEETQYAMAMVKARAQANAMLNPRVIDSTADELGLQKHLDQQFRDRLEHEHPHLAARRMKAEEAQGLKPRLPGHNHHKPLMGEMSRLHDQMTAAQDMVEGRISMENFNARTNNGQFNQRAPLDGLDGKFAGNDGAMPASGPGYRRGGGQAMRVVNDGSLGGQINLGGNSEKAELDIKGAKKVIIARVHEHKAHIKAMDDRKTFEQGDEYLRAVVFNHDGSVQIHKLANADQLKINQHDGKNAPPIEVQVSQSGMRSGNVGTLHIEGSEGSNLVMHGNTRLDAGVTLAANVKTQEPDAPKMSVWEQRVARINELQNKENKSVGDNIELQKARVHNQAEAARARLAAGQRATNTGLRAIAMEAGQISMNEELRPTSTPSQGHRRSGHSRGGMDRVIVSNPGNPSGGGWI